MTKSNITIDLDPGYDADILQWLGTFPPEERNIAILSAIRAGMTGEIDGDGLEQRLEEMQASLGELFRQVNAIARDVQNIEVVEGGSRKEKKSKELTAQDEDKIYDNIGKWFDD